MTIVELIAEIAKRDSDRVAFQWLNNCAVGGQYYNHEATKKKPERKYTEITFRTDNEKGRDHLAGSKQYVGVILWLPRDEVKAIIDSLPPLPEQDESEATND